MTRTSHRVRLILDEVFGTQNYCAQITFVTTTSLDSTGEQKSPGIVCNYLLWYAKDKDQLKYRQLYLPKAQGKSTETAYSWLDLPDGDASSHDDR